MKSSQAAFDLIVESEVSSGAYYDKHYAGFSWPGGASGPTVGCGYDVGYCTKDEIFRDWGGVIPPDAVVLLQSGAGLTGKAASFWVSANAKNIHIPWDKAQFQFMSREMTKWESRLDRALPNTSLLSPDSYGALVSLIYNRGTAGFTSQGDRFTEMRSIRMLMAARQFSQIPAQIRSMKRLWTNGLVARREREAVLFENGLRQVPQSIPTRGQTVLRIATTAGSAIGAGAGTGGAVYLLAPAPHAYWTAALAFTSSALLTVGALLYQARHRLLPRADPA